MLFRSVWGLFHGLFLVLERLGLATIIDRLPRPLRHVYVLLVVMVGWVFFRADSFRQAVGWLAALAGAGQAAPTPLAISWHLTPELMLALTAGCVGSAPVVPALNAWLTRPSHRPNRVRETAALAALAVLFAVSVVQVAAGTYNPFIYFRF